MNIIFLTKWVRKKHFRKIRRRLRANIFAVKCYDPYVNQRMATDLFEIDLNLPHSAWWGLVPKEFHDKIDICLRQSLIVGMFLKEILPELLCHVHRPSEPLSLGLPSIWQKHLEEKGVRFSLNARIFWMWFQIRVFLSGLYKAAKLLYFSLSGRMPLAPLGKGYAVLLQQKFEDPGDFNSSIPKIPGMVSWYARSFFRKKNEEEIWSQISGRSMANINYEIKIVPEIFPALPSLWKNLEFIIRVTGIVSVVSVRWIFGSWWAACLLKDAIEFAYVRTLESDSLAKTYCYNNSGMFYRPLWTYFAEQKGSNIRLLFYSTNSEAIPLKGKALPLFTPGLKQMNWSKYAVWTEHHKEFIRELGHVQSKVDIVGPILLASEKQRTFGLPLRSVMVFDVTVFRLSVMKCGIAETYYVSEIVCAFLEQTYRAIVDSGRTMILKRKRHLPDQRVVDKKYMRCVNDLVKRNGVIMVDPSYNAAHLIEKVDAVISIPFTSTAVVAHLAGKPSVFFDPLAKIDIERCERRISKSGELERMFSVMRQLHGVPIINDSQALFRWIESDFSKGII